MPSNVARLLRRSSALAPRSSPIQTPYQRLYATSPSTAANNSKDNPPTDPRTDATTTYALRLADQTLLRDTKAQLAKLRATIPALSIPLATAPLESKIIDPSIPGVAYTLNSASLTELRALINDAVPKAQAEALRNIDRVERHLTDLQEEEYRDLSLEDPALTAFRREIAEWSEEQKEDELQSMRLQDEAKLARLNENAADLGRFVDVYLRRVKGTDVAKPSFGGGGGEGEGGSRVVEVRRGWAHARGGAAKPKADEVTDVDAAGAATAPAPAIKRAESLQDLQRKLEASVSERKTS